MPVFDMRKKPCELCGKDVHGFDSVQNNGRWYHRECLVEDVKAHPDKYSDGFVKWLLKE